MLRIKWLLAMGAALIILMIVLIAAPSVLSFAMYDDASWHPFLTGQSKKSGNAIIFALERFRADNGCYPAKLAILEKEQGVAIDAPATGNGMWYYWSDGKFYTLSFEGKYGLPVCKYTSDDRQWITIYP